MHCKSLWIKASAKCININININKLLYVCQTKNTSNFLILEYNLKIFISLKYVFGNELSLE